MVQWLKPLVLVHENVTLEPVWKGLGDLVPDVRASRNSDWGEGRE